MQIFGFPYKVQADLYFYAHEQEKSVPVKARFDCRDIAPCRLQICFYRSLNGTRLFFDFVRFF